MDNIEPPTVQKKNSNLKFSRLRIIKNLTVISTTFVLLFTAYDGLSMLQSTMNGKGGIGSYSQAVVYLAFAVSCLFLPKYTIKKFGCKTNLFVGSVLYLPYIAANAYPTWATMMTSAVLIGIGASILWAAQCTYFNEAAGLYCDITDCHENIEAERRNTFRKTNLELFIIQNGISDKMISDLKSSDHFIKLNWENECMTKYKCPSSKIVSEKIVVGEFCSENTKINNYANYIDVKLEKNNRKDSNEFEQTDFPATLENSSLGTVTDTIEKFEILNCQPDRIVQQETLRHTDKNIEKITSLQKESTLNDIRESTDIIKPTKRNTKTSSSIESVTARFFGCFGMMYYFAQVWSNLLSYYVLSSNTEQNTTLPNISYCGASFCNSETEAFNVVANEIPTDTRYLLIGITSALSVMATLLVLVALDPLGTEREDVAFSVRNITATLYHLKNKEQLFLIPLSVFNGMSQGFYTADFTKSYIQCAWDITHVGLVTVFFGLACGSASTLSGCAVKYLGRTPVVLSGLVLHLGNAAFLLMWKPHHENQLVFYMEAAVFGIVVGIFYSQIQALYGLLFKNNEEVAFSSHYFCSAVGWTLSFTYSDYFCTHIKIYILVAASCVGICGYFAADRSFRKRSMKK